MTKLAAGEPELRKLSSGVEHSKGETKNLGELFKEAQKKYGRSRRKRTPKKKNEYKKPSTSGIYRVSKNKGLSYKQRFFFKFVYDKDDGKKSSIQRKTLKELYQAVLDLGYDFKVIDESDAIAFLNQNCNRNDFNFFCDKLCLTGDIDG